MPDRRRFSDTMPALDAITESHWDRLNGEERSDLLRKRHAQVIEVLRLNVDATHDVVDLVQNNLTPLLEANTAATARTEAKVDETMESHKSISKALDLLVARTEKPLQAWQNIEGTTNLIGWIGSFLKNAAWIVLPLGLLGGAVKAFSEWAKAGFPGFLK